MSTTPTTSPTRLVAGTALPLPGTWDVDPGHAEVAFTGRHFMLTKVRGRFRDVSATVEIAERPEDSTVTATIAMASVDSGDETRDAHLRSDDLFDVARYPTATFRSTGLTWDGTSGTLTGELTIRDRTRPVTLEVTYLGAVTDPWGADRAVFDAVGRVDREDWDITWNVVLEAGGVLVSKEIELSLHLELIRRS